MASAREKNGKWYYRITVSSCGKTKYIERGSYESKEEALEAGTSHELKLKGGDIVFIPTKITYGDMVNEWLTEYAPTQYKLNTIKTHKKVLKNYILPVLKDYEVSAVNTRTLQNIINEETPKHTIDGLYKIRSSMAKTFNYAIVNGYIRKDPLEGLVMPRKRSISARTLKVSKTKETCPKQLVNAIFDRFPEGHPCFIPLLLGYRCGLRLGEAYGLCIEDFDRVDRTLTIRRQIQYNDDTNELYFSDPKYCDPGEFRVIDLDSDTYRVLSRHVKKIEQCRSILRHRQYYVTPEGILNCETGTPVYLLNVRPSDGSYISPRTMQHVSRVIHGKESYFDCVDPTWDFHSLRHTHTSECIAAGMSPESVRKRLGHKSLVTTYRFYVHETETQSEKARMVLEGMFA